LADCCAAFGITIANAHQASADALAAAQLLIGYLGLDPHAVHWSEVRRRAASLVWPLVAASSTAWLPREQARRSERHFLTRLVDRLPDPGLPDQHGAYLAMLDQALLDRHLSLAEADGLVAVATELGMGRAAAQELHAYYVRQLAQVAWSDGVITETERSDLRSVGALLGLGGDEVDRLLAQARPMPGHAAETAYPTTLECFALKPGNLVAFTGEMSRLRLEWEQDAAEVGLVPHPAITKKVALLVAADPNSLSGKARKARDYGIPVVTEQGFARLLAQYQRALPERRQVPVATSTSLLDCGSR
ncbi:MAG: exonuclease domain-containing protein, partial [Pseudonocardiaceae bacterium]